MRIHPTGTDPTSDALLVCRNMRWNLLVLLAVFWAVPIFWWNVAAPMWVVYLCAVLPALLTWPLLGMWRKRGRADNWVLALYRDGIWLNLRDCEYHEAEPAETVLFVPYGEIAAARRFVHRYTTPSSDGDVSHKDVYLELQLNTVDTGDLRRALDEERQRDPPPHSYFGDVVTSQTQRTQAPIDLEGDAFLRVKFSVSSYGLRPSLKKVLATLQGFVTVDADQEPRTEDWQELDGIEFNELVRRLATGGERIEAIALLRRRKGMTTTEASQFVDELEKQASEPAQPAQRG